MVAVGIDPTEGPDHLRAYRDEQGYPWQLYLGDQDMFRDYQATIRATKVAVNSDGIVVYRQGYSVEPPEVWERLLQDLADS